MNVLLKLWYILCQFSFRSSYIVSSCEYFFSRAFSQLFCTSQATYKCHCFSNRAIFTAQLRKSSTKWFKRNPESFSSHAGTTKGSDIRRRLHCLDEKLRWVHRTQTLCDVTALEGGRRVQPRIQHRSVSRRRAVRATAARNLPPSELLLRACWPQDVAPAAWGRSLHRKLLPKRVRVLPQWRHQVGRPQRASAATQLHARPARQRRWVVEVLHGLVRAGVSTANQPGTRSDCEGLQWVKWHLRVTISVTLHP